MLKIACLLIGINLAVAADIDAKKEAFLTIDVGNSRIKSALFVGHKIVQQYFMANNRDLAPEQIKDFLIESIHPQYKIEGIGISSVVSSLNFPLLLKSKELDLPTPVFLNQDTLLRVGFTLSSPPPFGADRLAAALGAFCHFPTGRSIIIDSGTAITFTILDEKKIIHRGPILPGFAMCAEALHANTASLPLVQTFEPLPSPLPKNTKESIQMGIRSLIIGGCKEALEALSLAFNLDEFDVISSGGSGYILYGEGLSGIDLPNLKFYGLYYFIRMLEPDYALDTEPNDRTTTNTQTE